VVLGFVSVVLNTLADIIIAFAASGIDEGAAARPNLVRRLPEGSGAAIVPVGLTLPWSNGARPDQDDSGSRASPSAPGSTAMSVPLFRQHSS
jgi:hypothetical protein